MQSVHSFIFFAARKGVCKTQFQTSKFSLIKLRTSSVIQYQLKQALKQANYVLFQQTLTGSYW